MLQVCMYVQTREFPEILRYSEIAHEIFQIDKLDRIHRLVTAANEPRRRRVLKNVRLKCQLIQ
jgi:hypothetical protein